MESRSSPATGGSRSGALLRLSSRGIGPNLLVLAPREARHRPRQHRDLLVLAAVPRPEPADGVPDGGPSTRGGVRGPELPRRVDENRHPARARLAVHPLEEGSGLLARGADPDLPGVAGGALAGDVDVVGPRGRVGAGV